MLDRLIELLKKADKNTSDKGITDYEDAIADNAEYLLANGVIAPPCKVGDYVESDEFGVKRRYRVNGFHYEPDDLGLQVVLGNCPLGAREISVTRVVSKEEAEAKLKGEQ